MKRKFSFPRIQSTQTCQERRTLSLKERHSIPIRRLISYIFQDSINKLRRQETDIRSYRWWNKCHGENVHSKATNFHIQWKI